ncbi:alkaline phosphatase [Mycobacterium frederiksbergense]|uniref:Alkaline phosphatase n=1 Tax=Mycolicibacterium frederiksbergense TaxID=117567 RepID=A0ABT6KW23_9MYCO|nr:alkaline phosphatase [Mycolicibacterium frederiksbergense]MDH6194904.1 alkaline phosphatase [Mycolicibacterium frederiksbergense]
MSRRRYVVTAALVCTAALAAACGGSKDDTSALPLLDPAANGALSEHGGATRAGADRSALIADSINNSGAKNVILLIGDGMGDSEITVARNYAHGAGGAFPGLDAFPLTGQYTHYSLDKSGKPTYVADSAASGSAWATGTKTYNGAIAVDIHGKDQKTLLQLAKEAGKATGDISTAEIQDATPAVQLAHVTGRKCYGPDETTAKCPTNALELGGNGSITEQLLNTRADVVLGGGAKTFQQVAKAGEYQGKTLEVQAKERGFNIVRTADELGTAAAANQDAPLLGLFAQGNMPTRWSGPVASRGGYLEPAAECKDNPDRGASVPTLAAMTEKSIDLLKGNEKGFFLQVEGASIDKQDHAANPCGQIGETVDLDEAAKVALDFAKENRDTLVIVTADHAHSSQIVETTSVDDVREAAAEAKLPFEVTRDAIYPGLTRVLRSKDGQDLTVSYGTSDNLDAMDQGHTGSQLRIAAYGPGAAGIVGLSDQTDLFFTMARALGLKEN